MMPIGPLMIEHRLIEKMVELLRAEFERIKDGGGMDPVFIEEAVDFFRTYADRTHHGKEEDILFTALEEKELKPEHQKVMDELVEEHIYAREQVKALLSARNGYLEGVEDELESIVNILENLIELYPSHIEKEDKRFFIPVMDYFTDEEKDKMLEEFYRFDRKMIHEKYEKVIEKYQKE
jgi:hemerythrin-like domain-containing protein